MSLSLTTSQSVLSNWGFGMSDIAVLAGAGRAVGTWVMNQIKDQTLLQFMRVDPEDLIPRKGLIDTSALHQRWDVRLTLLHNGDRRLLDGHSTPLVESMGSFSWFMTLITCALDAMFQKTGMRLVLSSFLTSLFEEHVDGLEYLQRELPLHIQGWMSAAVVRNVAAKARDVWQATLDRNLRLPGCTPDADVNEVVRFLVWLAGAKGQTDLKRYETTSSDVFSFAIVLQSLGLDIIETPLKYDNTDFAESKLVIRYTSATLTTTMATEKDMNIRLRMTPRSGMRIPLEYPEECVSLWPGGAGANNKRRLLFKKGMDACRTLEIGAYFPPEDKFLRDKMAYTLHDPTMHSLGRFNSAVFLLGSQYFPIPTPFILESISSILLQNLGYEQLNEMMVWEYLKAHLDTFSQVQVFVLGYHYAMLQKVMDTSRLTVLEAYGTWKWFDFALFASLQETLANHLSMLDDDPNVRLFHRQGMFKLLALLIAGADREQLNSITENTIGVHGKISVVTPSLLGSVTSHSCALRFCLLDTDSTAIPSNAMGIVQSGESGWFEYSFREAERDTPQTLDDVDPAGLGEDFTSHIEPDWDNDIQLCQVVFRLKGRIVSRLAPKEIESAWKQRIVQTKLKPSVDYGSMQPLKVHIGKIKMIAEMRPPEEKDPKNCIDEYPFLFQTRGFVKARTCLVAAFYAHGMIQMEAPDPWPVLKWETDPSLEDEIKRRILLHPKSVTDSLRPRLCIILA